jgi:hypothetical protein
VPRSRIQGKAWISHAVSRLRPSTILDVGPGLGTYANLLRGITPGATWSCVEVFEPYVEMFSLRQKYDIVYICDVRYFAWPQQYDIVILGDVLEHLRLEDAQAVWASARAHARNLVLSIPIVEYPQGISHDNVHETHLHTWSHELVVNLLPGISCWERYSHLGVYLARGALALTCPRGHEDVSRAISGRAQTSAKD